MSAPPINKLESLFAEIELRLEGAHAFFSVALPTPGLLRQLPGYPRAATPSAGRTANGRGLTRAACKASCLGEAVELASSCAWGDEGIVRLPASDLDSLTVSPAALNGFTDEQLAERTDWNEAFGWFDWRPAPLVADAPCDWMQLEDALSGDTVYAPADVVLIGRTEPACANAVAIGDSNGCAAGATLDDARLAAILELVERDAVARWWYGRRFRPLVDLADVKGADVLLAYLAARPRRCRVYDITTDLDVPTFAAVSADIDGRDIALGSAAGYDMDRTILSALTEMLQMEISLDVARHAGDTARSWAAWRRQTDMTVPPLSFAGTTESLVHTGASTAPPAAQLRMVIDACHKAGVSLYVADLTRPAFGLPVARALSPDLCAVKPRYGRRRLLECDPRDLARPDDAATRPNPTVLFV